MFNLYISIKYLNNYVVMVLLMLSFALMIFFGRGSESRDRIFQELQ